MFHIIKKCLVCNNAPHTFVLLQLYTTAVRQNYTRTNTDIYKLQTEMMIFTN